MISLLFKWRNNMFGREKLATLVAEFLGAGILTFLVLSIYYSQLSLPYFASLATGIAFAGLMLAWGKFSGAVYNPAVAIGLWTVRKLSTLATVLYVVFEFLGSWVAVELFKYLFNSKLQTVQGHYSSRLLIDIAVAVFVLAMVWAAGLHQKLSRPALAATVGLGMFTAMLLASVNSMALLNPATALFVLSAKGWVWETYVLGSVVGAVVAFNLYTLVFDEEGLTFIKSIKITTTTASASPAPKAVASKKTAKRTTTSKSKKSRR